ncbi:POZ-, AT hook-, and zinc finger-containing protein 1 isoform X5 [Sminthopsis crassicaudata]|uniref:POZ-, AT hook-, and zinc finger-containing protein 1 isoform X5 n=1 Tax=Sminthopsis crassicaudata TaxID=9301 RepID=UPI003D681B9F
MERVSDAAAASCGGGGGGAGAPGPSAGCYTYQVSRHSTDMLHNLNQQRKNGGRFCDVLLRVGDESFPAHRAVLAACSEYFESVFSAQLGEGGAPGGAEAGPQDVAAGAPGGAGGAGPSRELEMHTISSKVFGDILDFAYTSRIVVRLESFPELMTAAKFLLMRSVIEICQEVIKQSNVQILVPPARADIMLFRPPGAADLGFPLDMTNGAGLGPNGNGIAGSMPPEDEAARAAGAAIAGQASLPVLPGVDRLPMVAGPLSPQLLASPFQNVGGGAPPLTGKRGRGRPRKANLLDSMMFGSPGGLREAGILPCGLCGKVFTDANRLRQHEAQHGVTSLQLGYIDIPPQRVGENGLPLPEDPDGPRKRSRTRKQVACEICGKIFRDVYHLNRHKLSHSGEKPYSCPVCGLRFKRKDRMSYHVRSHDGSVGKPYICQSCGKGFSRPDHLNGHIKQVHTSERPHKCQVWGGSSSGLPPLETLPSDLASWDFAQPALWRSAHSVPEAAFSLSLKKSFQALDNLGPAPSGSPLFCPAPPGYLRQGWATPEGSRAFAQWPVG